MEYNTYRLKVLLFRYEYYTLKEAYTRRYSLYVNKDRHELENINRYWKKMQKEDRDDKPHLFIIQGPFIKRYIHKMFPDYICTPINRKDEK